MGCWGVRPPIVKGAGHIGPFFLEFQGWPLWFMSFIALWGPHQLAPEVVPGASLHSEALSPECVWGGGMPGDWKLWTSSTCRSQAMGTIGADCSRVARELDLHLSRERSHWPPFPGILGLTTLVLGLHCTVGTSPTHTRGCFWCLIAL